MNIYIIISNKKIIFRNEKDSEISFNENNIDNSNKIVFDNQYFISKKKIVSNIINGIIHDNKINTVVVEDISLAPSVLDVISNIKKITNLNIADDIELDYNTYEKLLKNKSIKNIYCFTAPLYMLDSLKKNGITVNFRVEFLSNSNFVLDNKLDSYSKMYYKETIKFENVLDDFDILDFKFFLEINTNLSKVNIFNFSNELLEQIINILLEKNIRNVCILIRTDSNNSKKIQNQIKKLKKLNKYYKDKINLSIKIKYSYEYKKKNISKQVFNNLVKVSCLLIVLISLTSIGVVAYKNHMIKRQKKEINYIVENNKENEIIKEEKKEQSIQKDNKEELIIKEPRLIENYSDLLLINDETVGWLKVNNTKIDYPVVKGVDNDYYLKHDFYNNENFNGWIFMDYRNNIDTLDKNTIIYGHNMKSGMMFGTLPYVSKEYWYNNNDNLIIYFNTIHEKLNFQIFSIYTIDVTNDYLYTNFSSNQEYLSFIDKIKSRSIKDFGISINEHDKILTLSTCQDNSKKRLVVHAKLIKKV
ncbi:MAG: class B sortase [Firmicutes bacterium]|nr:class B sortase [Bacillota bacterium]